MADLAVTPLDQLATSKEVAEYLRVNPETLERLRANGEAPPAFRVGRQYRYRWSEVEVWLQSQAEVREHDAA